MRISWLVENGSREREVRVVDADRYVEKINEGGGDGGRKVESRVERVDIVDKGGELGTGEGGGTDAVIDVSPVELWGRASKLGKDLGLNITYN